MELNTGSELRRGVVNSPRIICYPPIHLTMPTSPFVSS